MVGRVWGQTGVDGDRLLAADAPRVHGDAPAVKTLCKDTLFTVKV